MKMRFDIVQLDAAMGEWDAITAVPLLFGCVLLVHSPCLMNPSPHSVDAFRKSRRVPTAAVDARDLSVEVRTCWCARYLRALERRMELVCMGACHVFRF